MGDKVIPFATIQKSYYDFSPSPEHRTGDLWLNVPVHGIHGFQKLAAIVITPACDLVNKKSTTITYLPIVSISEWLLTRDFLDTFKRILEGLTQNLHNLIGETISVDCLSHRADLEEAIRIIGNLTEKHSHKAKERDALSRIRAVLECAKARLADDRRPADISTVTLALGSRQWDSACEGLIRNSHRSDVHFLPPDGQDRAWSAIPDGALVLFRCPFTANIEIFDLAQDITIVDWSSAMRHISTTIPLAHHFGTDRPVKVARLRKEFLSDLLSRFGALYLRLGSPDFSTDSVEHLKAMIGGSNT